MNSGLICYTNSYSAYHNLATEEYLIRECEKNNIPILFIWQNENAVVIGKNQNAYTECNIEFAKENTIQIVRRTTGGGAVYQEAELYIMIWEILIFQSFFLNFNMILKKPLI